MNIDLFAEVQVQKLLFAGLLSALIGIERLVTDKPAGLRTCILIGSSACLFTILSVHGFGSGAVFDPSRVAAQIVVGVGFLGGGTLLHTHDHVFGLTTAASIWTVAAVGMAVGVGMYTIAIAMTGISLFTLWILAPVSTWIHKKYSLRKAKKNDRSTVIAAADLVQPSLLTNLLIEDELKHDDKDQ